MTDLARAFGLGLRESSKKTGDSDKNVRCFRCQRFLAELVSRPWVIKCSRCKFRNEAGDGYFRAHAPGKETE